MRLSLPLATLTVLLATPSVAGGDRRADIPEEIQVGGKHLRLNGTATFRKFIFSIYRVGLYLEERTDDPTKVLSDHQVRRLHIRLLRDAPKDTLINILRWRLQTVAANDYERIRERVDKVLGLIPDVRAGNELVITYDPARGTEFVAMDGRKLTIEGKDFADALFNVWLKDARVRPGLLGKK